MSAPWTMMVYVTFALGGASVYFLLPRSGRSTSVAGAVLGVAALAAVMVLCASKFLGTEGANGFFYLSAIVAVWSAVKVITHQKPVYSALYFVLTVLATAPLLLLQGAEFLAIAMIIIYAGAILVTYVFVIMLAQQGGQSVHDRQSREPLAAVFGGFLTMAVVAGQMAVLPETEVVSSELVSVSAGALEPVDNTAAVGALMLTQYVVAFEVAGVLLLIAMVGAISISKKRVPAGEFATTVSSSPGQVGREVPPY